MALSLSLATPWRAESSELRQTAVVRAVRQARSSVVNIQGEKTISTPTSYDDFGALDTPRRVNGMGTGVVVDERGYIITNHHVVQGVRRIQATLANGKTYYARIVSFDPQTDLALIKIKTPAKLPLVKLGDSTDLMIGEEVIAMGNAFGYQHTVTRGIVSALHRTVQISDTQDYEDLIQTDAAINPGNSGGPLLNIDGEMIGLNVAVRAGANDIGFAIPVNKVLQVAARLISVEQVSNKWHGIMAKDTADGEHHVVVDRVQPNSPGAKGGLRQGDVIIKVANREVERTLDFERALVGRKTGEEIEVAVQRDRQPVVLSFILASAPGRRSTTQERAWDSLGLRLRGVTAAQVRQQSSRYRGGMQVTEVRDASPADHEGIRPGDILVGMHIWETTSMDDIGYILNRPNLVGEDGLKFYVVRGRETLYGHFDVDRVQ